MYPLNFTSLSRITITNTPPERYAEIIYPTVGYPVRSYATLRAVSLKCCGIVETNVYVELSMAEAAGRKYRRRWLE